MRSKPTLVSCRAGLAAPDPEGTGAQTALRDGLVIAWIERFRHVCLWEPRSVEPMPPNRLRRPGSPSRPGVGPHRLAQLRQYRGVSADIRNQSSPGRGTCKPVSRIVIWTTGGLPDKCAMQASKTVAHADDELRARLTSNTPRPAIGKHVLIAGVSIMNNQLFKQLVELQGCTSMVTDDGEEGFQAAVKSGPDLIIVDAMGSVGFKLARSLRGDERTRDIPLIVVSSHNEDAIIATGHDVYDELVAKPIRVLDFLKLLDKWLLPT